MVAFAVALAPSVLVLSTGRIGRLLRLLTRRAQKCVSLKAPQPHEQQITRAFARGGIGPSGLPAARYVLPPRQGV
jgi:hypothetical protein